MSAGYTQIIYVGYMQMYFIRRDLSIHKGKLQGVVEPSPHGYPDKCAVYCYGSRGSRFPSLCIVYLIHPTGLKVVLSSYSSRALFSGQHLYCI